MTRPRQMETEMSCARLNTRLETVREHPSSDSILDRLKRIRGVYPQWAHEYVLGHINGLQLKHLPIHGTWAKDAADHWQGLGAALRPDSAPRVTRSTPKKKKEKERPEAGDEPAVVESTWPLLSLIQDKAAFIVGGAPKEPNRERLETFFRLSSLEWPLVDGPKWPAWQVFVAVRDIRPKMSTCVTLPSRFRHRFVFLLSSPRPALFLRSRGRRRTWSSSRGLKKCGFRPS